MATGVGGAIAIVLKRISNRVVGFSMGLASGVMLLVSFNSLFLEATKSLTHLELIASFSLGAVAMMTLDLTIPHIELAGGRDESKNRMFRNGLLIAAGVTLHNLPEGFVVASGYTFMPRLGLIIAIAITLHNIPEGFAIAIPFSTAGAKSTRIMLMTLISGLAEPAGALIGAVVFSFLDVGSLASLSLSFAAGVMTYITADELIPVAHEYGHRHTVSVALLIGIILALLVDVIVG